MTQNTLSANPNLAPSVPATGSSAELQPPELGHDVPITNLSDFVFVNQAKEIGRIAGTAADLPVTFDGGARSGRQFAQGLRRHRASGES